jgi:hypothetical protein
MNKTNRQDMNQKTDFNSWSISYLKDIYQCSKCKKRNQIVMQSNTCTSNNTNPKIQKLFQNCLYCGNPNYV